MVDVNDTKSKAFIKKHPELAERQFKLRPPRVQRDYTAAGEHTATGETGHEKRALVPRGAMQRAMKAGLVTAGMVNTKF
jgi:hypothetical protein